VSIAVAAGMTRTLTLLMTAEQIPKSISAIFRVLSEHEKRLGYLV
jgi:hypothetical protein